MSRTRAGAWRGGDRGDDAVRGGAATGTGLRAVFDQACAAQSLQPSIALQASAADGIAGLAARGLGVAILSDSMAESYRDRLTTRTIDDVETPALLALIWRNAHNPSVRELLMHSRRAFTDSLGLRE